MQAFIVAIAAAYGLLFGSFANVIIFRVPKGESIVKPPSHCPECGKRLTVPDLVPVFSWLVLRGRCRHCGVKIPARYPAVELLCAALFTFVALAVPEEAVIPLCLLAFVLLCVTFIDIDCRIIPDGLVIFGAVVGVLWVGASHFIGLNATFVPNALYAPTVLVALLGALAGSAPLFLIDRACLLVLKKDGFGFGDVKLMAMAGLFLGWRLIFCALFMAVIAGGLYGGVLMATRRAGRGDYFAFGPFLAVGILAAATYGEQLIRVFLPYL